MAITTRHLYEALLYNLENLADEYKSIHYMVNGKTVALNSWEVKEELERRLKNIEKDNECERTISKQRREKLLKIVAPCLLEILATAPEEGFSAEEVQAIFLDENPDDCSIEIDGYDYNMTDMFTHQSAYWAAEDWYEVNRNAGFEANNVRGMSLSEIKELDSGLLGLDMNLKPAKWYYNVYPEDNQLHDKYGSFIHINRVDKLEEIPRSVKIQMYVEYGFAVLEPRGVLFQEGI